MVCIYNLAAKRGEKCREKGGRQAARDGRKEGRGEQEQLLDKSRLPFMFVREVPLAVAPPQLSFCKVDPGDPYSWDAGYGACTTQPDRCRVGTECSQNGGGLEIVNFLGVLTQRMALGTAERVLVKSVHSYPRLRKNGPVTMRYLWSFLAWPFAM